MGILSAIEMACWDVVGKDLNRPVYDLLGGPVRESIRTYTYIRDADRHSQSILFFGITRSPQRNVRRTTPIKGSPA